MKKYLLTFLFIMCGVATLAVAKDMPGHAGDCASCHTLTHKEASDILKITGGTVKSIKQAPVKGMFEVLLEKEGKQGVIFLDYAKKKLMQGFVIDLNTLQPVAAHSQELSEPPPALTLDVKTIPVEHAVVMGNPRGVKKLYVFSDPDCPYCRKMHAELKNLEKIAPDVAIYVMMFPLPMHPGAYDKCRTVIARKSLELLDAAFEGRGVPVLQGDEGKAAVDAIVNFAGKNAISGTPTLILGNGKVVVGMRDASTLKNMLDSN